MPQRRVNLIVIHCSASTSGKPLQQGKPGQVGYLNAAQVINAWHAERGFSRSLAARQAFNPKLPSIGYHYVIDLTGEVYTGRGLEEVGAHAAEFNAASVGICLVGGVEPKDARYTAAQWASLEKVVQMLVATYKVPLTSPRRIAAPGTTMGFQVVDGVCGHRDLSPDKNGNGLVEPFEYIKTCPGFDVRAWMSNGMVPLPQHVCEVPA